MPNKMKLRITKSIFRDLMIWMLSFGVVVGLVFPFFVYLALDLPAERVLNASFIVATITAGLIVGIINFILVQITLGTEFNYITNRMEEITHRSMATDSAKNCILEDCLLEVRSSDEIGKTANTFNELIKVVITHKIKNSKINEISHALNRYIDLKKTSFDLLVLLTEMLCVDAAMCLVMIGNKWHVTSSLGLAKDDFDDDFISNTSGLVSKMMSTGKRVHVSIPDDVPLHIWGPGFKYTPKHFYIYPVKTHETIIAMHIFAGNTPIPDDAAEIYENVSPQIGYAIQNNLLHDRMKEIAIIDDLTKIYNRRFGMKRLKEEFSRVIRSHDHLAVIMTDIDHFKNVNDTYGHQAGDEILRQVSKIMKDSTREGDVLCRYGGEEFLIILPGCSQDDAFKLAERMRRLIEAIEVRWESGVTIRVTSSFGLTEFVACDARNETILVKKADQALYVAKEKGRNRTEINCP